MNDNVVELPKAKSVREAQENKSVVMTHIDLIHNFNVARDLLDEAATDYTNAKVALVEFQLENGIFIDEDDD